MTTSPAASPATSPAPSPASGALAPGSDCTAAFRAAYENRYTWEPGFPGYQGRCLWSDGERQVEGTFRVGADLKAEVEGIDDETVRKEVAGQLWEVAIHRVRRSFEQTHGENTFTAGDTDEVGTEVIVGGKGSGDRYRINNDVVTMVHRHIHGTVVTIFTEAVSDTGAGYLSQRYSSRYADPQSGEPRGGTSQYHDTFAPLMEGGPWVLVERRVATEGAGERLFRFEQLEPLAQPA